MKNGETLGEIQDLNLTYAIDQQLKRAMNEPLFKRDVYKRQVRGLKFSYSNI